MRQMAYSAVRDLSLKPVRGSHVSQLLVRVVKLSSQAALFGSDLFEFEIDIM
jgi:hypothetical protein